MILCVCTCFSVCGACTARGSEARQVTKLGDTCPYHGLVVGWGGGGRGACLCRSRVLLLRAVLNGPSAVIGAGERGVARTSAYITLAYNTHKPGLLLLGLLHSHCVGAAAGARAHHWATPALV